MNVKEFKKFYKNKGKISKQGVGHYPKKVREVLGIEGAGIVEFLIDEEKGQVLMKKVDN